MADDLTLDLELGRLTIARDAFAEIVAETALGCYGVVGLSAGTRVGRLLRREGITVEGDAKGLRIELHVVVEHGLNLAEVAATIRSQVAYEVTRLTGFDVTAVEVVIQRVRVGA
ncbi:MAG TPA: Asp23/Gls24 family envelope stress response protein [Gaiellaceae bacterium]|nr:Asp23/Gls24 family envelope stress response protein [Gaiellaceae bacterium]